MSTYVKTDTGYKLVYNVWVKVDGAWKKVPKILYKFNNSWSEVHTDRTGFIFNAVISASTNNYNLRAAAIAAGWDTVSPLSAQVTINSGVLIGSTSIGQYAFSTGSSFPDGSSLVLTNKGRILGKGGDGGDGASWIWSGYTRLYATPAQVGKDGGPALFINLPTTLVNIGVIAGGGGGGGGAGSLDYYDSNGNGNMCGGGGGGGGQGYTASTGGWGGTETFADGGSGYPDKTAPYATASEPGTSGTADAPGTGGVATADNWYGGNGGALGMPGTRGQDVVYISPEVDEHTVTPGANGGLAGAAITGMAYCTLSGSGSVLGAKQQ